MSLEGKTMPYLCKEPSHVMFLPLANHYSLLHLSMISLNMVEKFASALPIATYNSVRN